MPFYCFIKPFLVVESVENVNSTMQNDIFAFFLLLIK